jgi:hypothetical protein
MSGIHQMLLASGENPRPEFVSATTASQANGVSANLTINTPSGTASGDLLIAVLVNAANVSYNQLTGWTRLVNATTGFGSSLQYRIADGTEGASFTFTAASGTAACAGSVMRFRYAASCYVGTVGTGNSTSPSAPGVTITKNKSLVLSVFTANAAGVTWTGVRPNSAVTFSTQRSFNVSYDNADAGLTADDAATQSVGASWAAYQVGLSS